MDYLHVQVDKHGITIFTTYIRVDLANHEIFYVKVGKGGIMLWLLLYTKTTICDLYAFRSN